MEKEKKKRRERKKSEKIVGAEIKRARDGCGWE